MAGTLYAFGINWSIELETVALRQSHRTAAPDVRVRFATPGECRLRDDDGPSIVVWSGMADSPIVLERGPGGDHLFDYGDRARFLLPAALDEIRCFARDPHDPAWQRVLFDTVMFSMGLLRGGRMLHAAAVALDRQVVAIVGLTGGGKSSLAWELMRRGASFVSDDVLALWIDGRRVTAASGPPLMNLPTAWPLEAFSREIAAFPDGDERWVHLTGAVGESLPMAAFVLLNRRAGQVLSLERLPSNPIPLLAHSIHLDNAPSATASRFTLLADVADRVPIYGFAADVHDAPETLAGYLVDSLRRGGALDG